MGTVAGMKVALTAVDFIRRAELVYGDRIGLIDEPDQPAESWGELTYKRMAELARAQAAGLDRLGIGQGERVAIVSQNSARLMTSFFGVSGSGRILVPINFRLNVDEVSLHRRALRRVGAARRSRARRVALGREREVSVRHRCRGRRRAARVRSGARALDSRRRRDRDHQLHERHDGAAEGRAAHAPQHLGQRDDVRLADGRDRSRRLPAHAADVPLQRLGDALRGHRHGRAEHRAAQGRRRGDPASCRQVRSDVAVRSACRRCDDPRRGSELGRSDPGRRAHAHGGRRRAAAHSHDRAHRDRARLGVHPDLRAHRDVPVPRDEPRHAPSSTT